MKFKALLMTLLFAAGLAASVAVAKGPPPGKGKGKDDSSSSSASTPTGTSTTSSPGKGKGKGKPKNKGDATSAGGDCKPTVSFILKGEFVAGAASSTGSTPTGSGSAGPAVLGTFEMKVTQANAHGGRYVGKTVTISYDAKTKFKRRGHATIDDFEAGDWLNVHVRGCKKKKGSDSGDAGTSTGSTTTTPSSGSSTGATDQPLLLAKMVVGKPKKEGSDDSSGSTTTSPTSTTPTSP